MPPDVVQRGILAFGVEGIERVKAADSAVRGLEATQKSATATATAAAEKTGALAALQKTGGERMARYATSVGLLSGQMQRMGVQNDLVARGFGIVTEAVTGMLGPIGIATIALGAVATAIGSIITKQKEVKAQTAETAKSLVDYAARYGITDETIRRVITDKEGFLAKQRTGLEAMLDALEQQIATGQGLGGQTRVFGRTSSGSTMATILGPGSLEELKLQAQKLRLELAAVVEEQEKVKVAFMGGSEAPFVGPAAPTGGGTGTATKAKGRALGFEPRYGVAWGLQIRPGSDARLDEANQPAKDPYEEMVDQAQGANDRILAGLKIHVSEVGRLYQIMGKTAVQAYNAAAAAGRAAIGGLTAFVEANIEKQGKANLKLRDVAELVAREGLAAFIEQKSQEFKIRAGEYGMLALGLLATGNVAGAAKAGAAAAGFAALAGGIGGAAAAIRSEGAEHWGSASRNRERDEWGADYGTSSTSSSGPGARYAGAGASPTSISISANMIFNGPVVYGSDGLREMFRRDMVPLIQEAIQNGLIALPV